MAFVFLYEKDLFLHFSFGNYLWNIQIYESSNYCHSSYYIHYQIRFHNLVPLPRQLEKLIPVVNYRLDVDAEDVGEVGAMKKDNDENIHVKISNSFKRWI